MDGGWSSLSDGGWDGCSKADGAHGHEVWGAEERDQGVDGLR
jgi:hypothetical protein